MTPGVSVAITPERAALLAPLAASIDHHLGLLRDLAAAALAARGLG